MGVKVEGIARDKDCPQRGDTPTLPAPVLMTMVGRVKGGRCTGKKKITFGVNHPCDGKIQLAIRLKPSGACTNAPLTWPP